MQDGIKKIVARGSPDIVIMVIKAIAPSVNQLIETGIEEISIKVLESHQDGLLNFVIGFEMPFNDPKRWRSFGARAVKIRKPGLNTGINEVLWV